MKTIFAPCMPDEDVEMGHTSAWMRVELPDLARLELQELVTYFHAAPQAIVQLTARLSMVVTVFDDADRGGHTEVCQGVDCGIPAEWVRPSIEPPWVQIESDAVYFGIQVIDAERVEVPYNMVTTDVPYALLGLEVHDAVLETR
jgi:hypothetical protein